MHTTTTSKTKSKSLVPCEIILIYSGVHPLSADGAPLFVFFWLIAIFLYDKKKNVHGAYFFLLSYRSLPPYFPLPTTLNTALSPAAKASFANHANLESFRLCVRLKTAFSPTCIAGTSHRLAANCGSAIGETSHQPQHLPQAA